MPLNFGEHAILFICHESELKLQRVPPCHSQYGVLFEDKLNLIVMFNRRRPQGPVSGDGHKAQTVSQSKHGITFNSSLFYYWNKH